MRQDAQPAPRSAPHGRHVIRPARFAGLGRAVGVGLAAAAVLAIVVLGSRWWSCATSWATRSSLARDTAEQLATRDTAMQVVADPAHASAWLAPSTADVSRERADGLPARVHEGVPGRQRAAGHAGRPRLPVLVRGWRRRPRRRDVPTTTGQGVLIMPGPGGPARRPGGDADHRGGRRRGGTQQGHRVRRAARLLTARRGCAEARPERGRRRVSPGRAAATIARDHGAHAVPTSQPSRVSSAWRRSTRPRSSRTIASVGPDGTITSPSERARDQAADVGRVVDAAGADRSR